MAKINILDVWQGRLEEVELQLKRAKYKNDRVSIVKLTAEKKRILSLIEEKQKAKA